MVNDTQSALPTNTDTREVVRHLVATLAYRAAKVLRDVPPEFRARSFGADTRSPVLILTHMADLIAWAVRFAHGTPVWKAEGTGDWDTESQRFFDSLAALDRELEAGAPFGNALDKLIQGPLADALTHVGQLALLRGMAGIPVRPEAYPLAPIVRGHVGMEQGPAGREFNGDASVR